MPIWNPSLAIGVPAIDSQHQELFKRADSLLAAMAAGRAATEITPLFDFLKAYCATHFASEEKLMKARAYPGMAAHLAQHAEFGKKFEAIEKQFAEKGATSRVVLDVNQLIGTWLVQHIGTVDTKLAQFLGNARSSVSF
ncbi:MAG: hemerythrin family protein [Anaeromyxobacter sp.]